MFINGDLYISEKYRLLDYIKLSLNMNSCAEDWNKAIDIFISRINGRYFNAINKLSSNGKYVSTKCRQFFYLLTLSSKVCNFFENFNFRKTMT
mgnify:CR=1 FL=1